jgi:hypothetical protein
MRESCHRHLPRERFSPMALSWRNLPCALKTAIGFGKRTLGHPASLPRHMGRGKPHCASGSPSSAPNTLVTIGAGSPAAVATRALRNRAL